jgi:hypothetical protein
MHGGSAYEGQPAPVAAHFPDQPRLMDDTWLTVATCDAIVRANGRVEPAAIAQTFREYFERGGAWSRRLNAEGASRSPARSSALPAWRFPTLLETIPGIIDAERVFSAFPELIARPR